MNPSFPYKVSAARGLAILIFGAILMSAITSAAVALLGRTGMDPVKSMRLATIFQDFLVFILPAFAASLLATKRAADLLAVRTSPGWKTAVLAIVLMAVSTPLQEAIIYWNYHLDLSWLGSTLEQTARTLEDSTAAVMRSMMSSASVGTLIINVLIIGVLAGFSEELFFRGGLQRLLTAAGLNAHVAIWLIAIVFSALHLQFYGFVPRVLLGVLFGYMLLWSGSLWLPVLMHIINNSVYVFTVWLQVRANGFDSVDFSPSLWPMWVTIISAVLTVAALWMLKSVSREKVLNEVKS